MISMMEIQDLVFIEYCGHGFIKKFSEHGEVGDIAELGLIGSEISEAMEVIRTGQGNLDEEVADIIIRALNFLSRKKIDAEGAILEKNMKNIQREPMHGKLV